MVPLNPARFNALLGQFGQQVQWRRAAPCPCRDMATGQASYGHKLCAGTGILWAAPAAAWTGLAGMRLQREYAAYGRWESGDVLFSIPGASPLWAAGENDRIVLTQSTEPFQIILTRGEGDRIPNGIVVEVDRAFWLTPDRSAIVEGDTPTVDATSGAVSWAAGAEAPDPGQEYTLVGRRNPEFFVFGELPRDRAHFGGLPLPRLVHARRFDLLGKQGVPT